MMSGVMTVFQFNGFEDHLASSRDRDFTTGAAGTAEVHGVDLGSLAARSAAAEGLGLADIDLGRFHEGARRQQFQGEAERIAVHAGETPYDQFQPGDAAAPPGAADFALDLFDHGLGDGQFMHEFQKAIAPG